MQTNSPQTPTQHSSGYSMNDPQAGRSNGHSPQGNPSSGSGRGNRGGVKTLRRNAWTIAASLALVAFTVFVLLDTFVVARVQQTVQQADLSSIVAAQGNTTAESATGANTSDSSDSASSSDSSAADSSDSSSESTSSEESSSSSHGPKNHSGTGGKRHRPGSAGGKGPGSSSSDSSSSKPGKRSSGSSSSSESSDDSSSTDTSEIVEGAGSASTAGTVIGEYSDENMTIKLSSLNAYDTDIYVADIQVSSAEYLKTALAQNSFGRNLKDTTSNMAKENNAVLAINGDYYGFRDDGYVLRNGVLYRDTASSGTDALVVYGDGSMASVSQDDTTAQQLKDSGAWQVLSFGPTLVSDGSIAIDADEEVSRSMGSNPRTAIGMISPLHYVVVVSDGRTGDNDGLTLYELAQVLVDNGATYAYNLDGGGSTTLYFKGEVINNPTSGNVGGERSVSDIVYFG